MGALLAGHQRSVLLRRDARWVLACAGDVSQTPAVRAWRQASSVKHQDALPVYFRGRYRMQQTRRPRPVLGPS